MRLSEYKYKNYRFLGCSEGGVYTTMGLPQYKLVFDIGVGHTKLTEYQRLLLTHGHLDHSSGIAYYISQRALRRLDPPDIYCPPELADPLKRIFDIWAEIEGFEAGYNLHPVQYDQYYKLQGNVYFKAIPSIHRVPSNGYAILEKTRKLKDEFQDLPGHEIAVLKQKRDDLFYDHENPVVTFSGDTQIEFVLQNEIVRRSKILFLECTYVDEKRPVERARQWGHIHLFEIAEHAEAFRDIERLFLIHFSPRYKQEVIVQQIKEVLPDWLAEKTTPSLYSRDVRNINPPTRK